MEKANVQREECGEERKWLKMVEPKYGSDRDRDRERNEKTNKKNM